MQNILITGSNRGIGLALVKEYVIRDDVRVFATCRNPNAAHELQQLDNVTIIPLDVTDESSINASVELVKQHTDILDTLINNAGINPPDEKVRQFGSFKAESIANVLNTNSISPIIVTQAYMPLLRNSTNPQVVMVSSQMGSITRASGSALAYRMSKAAVNMATKVLSQSLHGVTIITTHPGWVQTDMGGSGAPVKPNESARGLVKVIDNLKPSDTGRYFNYTGEEIPW